MRSDIVHGGRFKRRNVVQLGQAEHRQAVVVRQPVRQPLGAQGLQLRHVVLVRQGQEPQQVRPLLLPHPAVVEVVEQGPPGRQVDVLQHDPTAVPLFHVGGQQGLEDGRPFFTKEWFRFSV